MGSYTLAATLDRPYEETVQAVRKALDAQGFGVLTEIDLRADAAHAADMQLFHQLFEQRAKSPVKSQGGRTASTRSLNRRTLRSHTCCRRTLRRCSRG